MRKIFLFGLLASFFIFGKIWAANTDIVVNEIGAYATSTHEWIEIWNEGSESVDMSGWKFWEDGANHGLSSTVSVVSPGEYAIIAQDAGRFKLDYPFFSGSVFDSSWGSLNESGEEVGLKDAEGNFVEKFIYLSAPDFSLERANPFISDYTSANWQQHASGNTVGAINSNFNNPSTLSTSSTLSTPSTISPSPLLSSASILPPSSQFFSSLKINEFVSNPATGNEWVELYNPASEAVDITGGYICDARISTSTCKPLAGAIDAGGWLFFDLLTDSYLNNDGDSVILKNSAGAVVDRVDYGDKINPDKGESLARKTDGADTDNISDWAVTTQLTPSAGNIIFQENSEVKVETTSSTKTAGAAQAKSKEKQVGLRWKIKYDPRLRQNQETVFSASSTLDPRGGRIAYAWDFGDKIIFGPEIKYSFATSGAREIIVRATSTAGTVDQKKIKIIVYPENEILGAGVIFTEIFPDNFGRDEAEYLRVKNITSSTIDISNWKLAYNNDAYEIPTSSFILAGDYLTFYKTITGFSLNNSGGQVLLLNDKNELIDEAEYKNAKEGVVYIFDGEKCPDCQSGSRSLREKWKSESTSPDVVKKPAVASSAKTILKGYNSAGISQARDFEKGRQVKVRGVVSAIPGNFGVQFFYISDNESGIQIYQYKKDFPKLAVGDMVEVKGTVSAANNIKRINIKSAKDIDILSIGHNVVPVSSSLEELVEENVGGLVKISGEITEIKSNLMYVDDGATEAEVYFKNNAKIDKKKFKEGELVEVAGVLEKGKNGLQIWPRSNNDIVYAGLSQDLLDKQAAAEKAMSGDAAEKYLTATAGGITTLLLAFLARARGLLIVGGLKKIASLGSKFIKRG